MNSKLNVNDKYNKYHDMPTKNVFINVKHIIIFKNNNYIFLINIGSIQNTYKLISTITFTDALIIPNCRY